MDDDNKDLLNEYLNQLAKVDDALQVTEIEEDRNNLQSLRNDLLQLIQLVSPPTQVDNENNQNGSYDNEYKLFMAEMQKEGAIENESTSDPSSEDAILSLDSSNLEGSKCRAPHTHSWGATVLHNALISSVLPHSSNSYDQLKVKVLFTNPTHKEMLPCPYFLEGECKFTEEKCRFSHGEIVPFSNLEEHVEPDYAGLEIGSLVLAKQDDKLWHRGMIKRIFESKESCVVRLEHDKQEVEVAFVDIHPMSEQDYDDNSSGGSDLSDNDEETREDFINLSLVITPTDDKLGSWEKYTKGIGSKLMQKMGYVIGTGLGRHGEGIIEPVTAVALPAGKSLDHCMELREKSGGDKNLFNVERKLKRLQRKQEQKNQKNYERESNKVDVFNFLNETLSSKAEKPNNALQLSKSTHRKEIKQETSRNLNVESFKLEKRIGEVEVEIIKIKQAMQRNTTSQNSLHKQLDHKYKAKVDDLKILQSKLQNIKHEQSLRNTTRKLTVF